ncbi:AarF/ABC1/UbiB kinase family protein [uncultured Kiloniella sp.]|uniref:ABC1 kinase family protein n=1 Tax=uncultured Kiloniella sp. TaxID=1133091 RepID=UPI002605EB25|nr:AarF/ABC1/UbiB kinase family protein [uncultured Kiloniella sp.]
MGGKGSIATRKLHRSATIGLTATKVGLRHLGHVGKKKFTVGHSSPEQDEDARIKHEEDIGKTLFKALNQLKGTALKASQILSMEADILPEGIRRELSKACYKATPLNRALVDKVFRDQFGKSPGKIFDDFNSSAFAAASLGQVHKAKLGSGEDVAVKVQYPGIAASIKSDVKMLGGLLTVFSASTDLMPDKNIIDTVLDEITIQLHREVDYFQEAESLKWFKKRIKNEKIVVPETYDDYSSERILTTELLTGFHLDEWLATNPSQDEKNAYGQLLFDFFFDSFFELGFVHADPHPGNFLFMKNGKLGLLDFGCVRKMDREFTKTISDYYKFLIHHHTVEPDYERLRHFYEDLELSKDDMSNDEFRSILQPQLDVIQKWMIEPYLEEEFDFTNREWPEMKMADTRKITPFMKEINRNLLYFDRTYRGMILLLSKLGATVRTGNKWIGV